MTDSRPAGAVTIVTQTRVHDSGTDAFAKFQATISAAVAEQPGFIEQSVLPPDPPTQVDWVILQRFLTSDDAVAWLRSERRRTLLTEIQSVWRVWTTCILCATLRQAPCRRRLPPSSPHGSARPGGGVSCLGATHRCSPGELSRFQGYRFEPPIPGVQENYVAILRFESEETLQGWMDSPERHRLIKEAEELTEDVHARIVRSGFSQWFPDAHAQAPAWKMNMIVLLLLYPVVFLFGLLVQTPLLMRGIGLPFWLALFIGNVASVLYPQLPGALGK